MFKSIAEVLPEISLVDIERKQHVLHTDLGVTKQYRKIMRLRIIPSLSFRSILFNSIKSFEWGLICECSVIEVLLSMPDGYHHSKMDPHSVFYVHYTMYLPGHLKG